ncbi:hypothetical protein DCS_04347 [Drechmeria coniospora]|uniref:Kinetochore protein fta4 n=1 Tax=Drechmeria coniospora TaxID=98403 RepID=A0A151GJS7_DRECN|nr:hypothetical protein DCS_04347 [Drechmeria coniospora]KYK57338.1 hypothetical protein DCS_04347 [Drechmeria coniospora]
MAMPPPAPTIPSLKKSFLTSQAALLAQPLAPSRSWHDSNDASDKPIPSRLLDSALASLNQTIQRHARRVYPPQAAQNVALQIESAYLREAERRVGGEAEDDGLSRDIDLSTCHSTRDGRSVSMENADTAPVAEEDVIEALPESWPSERDVLEYPMEAKRYADAVGRLAELSERRKGLAQRVERLGRLKAAVDPFQTTDSTGAGIQENLITRDGAVEKELERMRVLLARVAGRIGDLRDRRSGDGKVDLAALGSARKRNVDEFLADSRVFPS